MCFGKQTNFRNSKSQPITLIPDLLKNLESALFFQVINSVQRTLFICSSTCRKAEHVEQPEYLLLFYVLLGHWLYQQGL